MAVMLQQFMAQNGTVEFKSRREISQPSLSLVVVREQQAIRVARVSSLAIKARDRDAADSDAREPHVLLSTTMTVMEVASVS